MNLPRIPLLGKERLGEVEPCCHPEAITVPVIERDEEATSPRYWLVHPAGRDLG